MATDQSSRGEGAVGMVTWDIDNRALTALAVTSPPHTVQTDDQPAGPLVIVPHTALVAFKAIIIGVKRISCVLKSVRAIHS